MIQNLLCLSDLHLGARDSLLSNFTENGKVGDDPGPVLASFAEALRATVSTMFPKSPVTLVLLGDALDLGLSPMGDVCGNLLHFLKVLFPSDRNGDTAPFAGDIIYIPGNHDHHIWRMAQDEQYIDLVGNSLSGPLKHDILQASPIADEPALACRLVTGLMQRVPALRGSACKAAYPNWAILDPSGKRAVVLHHGHYVDPMYMALSRMAQWMSGSATGPRSATDVERCNGPWVDFLWSDLGSAGAIGRGAGTLYDVMMDAEASHEFAGLLSKRIAGSLATGLGIQATSPLAYNLTPGRLISAAIDFTAGRTAESERNGYRDVLSTDEIESLLWYLANPIARQFQDEYKDPETGDPGPLPEEIAFIFGHTHKPFQDQVEAPPFPAPTAIYNTGGWVLDEPTLMPCQGAAAVLVDDALNVASLRLFNDVTNGAIPAVRAEGIGGVSDLANPLLANAKTAIGDNAETWSKFSAAAKAAIEPLAERRVQSVISKLQVQQQARPAGVIA